MRVNHGVEPIKSPPGTDRDGSRPKPPKAVALLRASLEASWSVPDHQKSKRRLIVKTVAFMAQTVPPLPFKSNLPSIPEPSCRKARSNGLFGSDVGVDLSRLSSWF
jgi:hypothetical protein